MTSQYRILSPGLHETADATVEWFVNYWGIARRNFVVETSFDDDVDFRPTFVTELDDGHLLCVEVSENIYSKTLDSVVLACQHKGLPVKLVVAVPRGAKDPDFPIKLRIAKRNGVGILEVDAKSGTMLQSPLSLSLVGVRPLQLSDFPPRYRQPLQHAHQVFRDGEPSKACSLVYDELEAGCRQLASKCAAKGIWKPPSGLKLDVGPWAKLMSELDKGLDRKDPLAKRISKALIARIIGVTPHRNDSGHKPKTLKTRMNRDQELRTRFEGGVDLLREFTEVAKPFRI